MTLEELRAEGQRLYSEAEKFYISNRRSIDAQRANYDSFTMISKLEKLDHEAAAMLNTNAKRFEALVKSVTQSRPDLEPILKICCSDFYRTRGQMSRIGQRFFEPKETNFF